MIMTSVTHSNNPPTATVNTNEATTATVSAAKKPDSPPYTTEEQQQQQKPLSETDPKAAKKKAAEQKLQLLGTIQAIQKEGKLPPNAQLVELLEKLAHNQVIVSRENFMSQDGRILLNDFRKLIKTLEKALQVKNKDELFQKLVYHLHCMESPISKDELGQSIKVSDKTTLKQEGKQASNALWKISKLLLINNEFRSLLGELIDISQGIFSSVTSKIGESITQVGSGLQKDENQPNASGRHLVDKYLDKALDPNKRKSVDINALAGIEHQQGQEQQHRDSIHDQEPHLVSSPTDDPRHQGLLNTGDFVHPNAIPGGFPGSKQGSFEQQVATTTGGGQQQPYEQQLGATLGQQMGGAPTPAVQQGTALDQHVDPNVAHNLGGGTSNKYQEKIEDYPMYKNAKAEMYAHKDHAHATVEENIPKEKQDELLHRFQHAVAQVQKHPDYQDAIETLINLIQVWSTRVSKVSEEVKANAKEGDHPEQENYRELAEREVKTILELWAQGQSIDPLLHGVQQVMRDMQNDDYLRDFYHTVMHYINRLIREPGYANSDHSTQEGKRLMDRGNEMIKGRYREHLEFLQTEGRKLINLMAEDEISKELNHRIATIHRDLWMDIEGNPAFKPQLLDDMRMTLLPAFIDEIKYIPVPRIEHSDPQYDITIEDLVISGDTLLPNIFETKAEIFNSFSLKSATESKPSRQSLYVRMSEIQAEIDDVVFYYKKKTGFPKLSDKGNASLHVGGKGITIAVRLASVVDNPAKTFKVTSCKCNVDNLKVKVNESNHDILYKAIRPLLIGVIRKQVAKAIEGKVTEMLNRIDQRITNSIVEMNQNLQNKAYAALPEEEKASTATAPISVSQARPRPGLFSTIVAIINNNIKTKVQQRNEAKRMEHMSMSQDDGNCSSLQVEAGGTSTRLNPQQQQRGIVEHGQQGGYASSGNGASLETDRHNYISPPHSPKKFGVDDYTNSATTNKVQEIRADAPPQHQVEQQQIKQTQN